MGPLMGRLAQQLGSGAPLAPIWAEIVGPLIASHARPARLSQGVLTIACDSAAWREALSAEHANTLRKLQHVLGESTLRSIVYEGP